MKVTRRSGFTLAEVMVTIMIVGIGLTMVVQALSVAKFKALQTYNVKAARDLGMLTLGRIRAGMYQEELDTRLTGSYAEEGFEYFDFEVRLGDEQFDESNDDDTESPFHDTWRAREEREEEAERESGEDDSNEDPEEMDEDYEKVRIKVNFPKVGEYTNYVVLEEWIPWDQVYGLSEEEQAAAEAEAEEEEGR